MPIFEYHRQFWNETIHDINLLLNNRENIYLRLIELKQQADGSILSELEISYGDLPNVRRINVSVRSLRELRTQFIDLYHAENTEQVRMVFDMILTGSLLRKWIEREERESQEQGGCIIQ